LFTGRRSKGLLRAAVGSRLPNEVLRHHKWGFGVPWKQYLREVEELRSLLLVLPNAELIQESPLERTVIQKQVHAFLSGDDRPFQLLMQIFMVAISWEAVNRSNRQSADASL